MQYGVCGGPDLAPAAHKAGYDYIEWSVGGLLKPQEDDAAFEAALAQVRAGPLPCPVLNCFIPGTLRITGPDVNPDALQAYVATAFARAQRAGVTRIVFGSGGARRVPDGFEHPRARGQILDFLRMAAPLAARHGVTVCVEPLNTAECNILTHLPECAALVREVNQPAVRLLADTYHFLRNGETAAELAPHAEWLAHLHIATPQNRLPPGAEPCDFAPFFQVLARSGYAGGLSFEGKIPDPDQDLPRALALMKELARA